MKSLLYLILVLSILQVDECAGQLKPARTPPMGWNSWNCFRSSISERKIMEMATAMVSSGMKDAGYEYVIVDDGWMLADRDSTGHQVPDPRKFPHGMRFLADYIHGLGLKFGIYASPGCFTCQKLAGSLGHEQTDADDFAAWGVDYLKYDWCNYPGTPHVSSTSQAGCRKPFELMHKCLEKTGRSILYSINDECSRDEKEQDIVWVKSVANMHRTSDDIKNNWERMLYCLDQTADFWRFAGPGYWNDPDMLEVGNEAAESLWDNISPVKMNIEEYRSHFSMWCMVAAPLIAGNDLRNQSPEILDILTRKELIAIDQDTLGIQGHRVSSHNGLEIWVKKLAGGKHAIALFNRSSRVARIRADWKILGIEGRQRVIDLWRNNIVGTYLDSFMAKDLKSHEARIYLFELAVHDSEIRNLRNHSPEH